MKKNDIFFFDSIILRIEKKIIFVISSGVGFITTENSDKKRYYFNILFSFKV